MQLDDRIAIENLIFRYARYVDTARYEALGRLFQNGTVTANTLDGSIVGEDAVREYWKSANKRYPDGTPRTHHMITNLEFEVGEGGRHVDVRSCFMVFQATELLPLQPIAGGRYQDRFQKFDGVWGYVTKHIEVTMLGEMSHHLNVVLS